MSQTKKSSDKVSKGAEKKAKTSRAKAPADRAKATGRRSDRLRLENTKTLTIRLCPATRKDVREKLALSGLSVSAGLRMVMSALAAGTMKLPSGLPRDAGSLLEDRVTVLVNRKDLKAATEATGMSDGEVGRALLLAIANETIVLHSPRASFVEAAAA